MDFTRPAEVVGRVVRVGGAHTTFRGRRLKVWSAVPKVVSDGDGPAPGAIDGVQVGCAPGSVLELVEVQPEGRARQAAADWVRGVRLEPGDRLGA